jgi:DNA-binding NarL/FixJ family response regulator
LETVLETTVLVCDTEPVAIAGIRSMLGSCNNLLLVGAEDSLITGFEMVNRLAPAVVVLDKAFGIHTVMDWIRRLRMLQQITAPVVWGSNLTEAEALRLVQAGALGVIRKSARAEDLFACLLSAGTGEPWTQDSLKRDRDRAPGSKPNLTAREHQVLELVEQGMRNKEIAARLGIRPGTVKIHLKHIFEKTGIHGRYGLAISYLKEKGLLSLPVV